MRRAAATAPPLLAALGGYSLLARGALTLDLGVGRRVRSLGPIARPINAAPEVIFDVIAAPYLGRTPRAMSDKLRVWERGTDMVLAEHITQTGSITTSTLETVLFERPNRVSFRLVRGPVPHVAETYEIMQTSSGSDFLYTGELGTDLWKLGELWAGLVARPWELAVAHSLDSIQAESERLAGAPAA